MAKRKKDVLTGEEPPPRVDFNYIKSSFFRVVHADGAWIGITPTINLHIVFYSERPAIPQRMAFKVHPDGTLGEEIVEERSSKKGIVREAEVAAVMQPAQVQALIDALQKMLLQVEHMNNPKPKESAT